MIRWLRAVVLLSALCAGAAGAQQVALTFDDGLDPVAQPEAAQWNAAILRHLRQAGVEPMLFPSLARIGGEAGLPLVREWSDAGYPVGNHTASHRSLSSHRMSLQEFIADVERAHKALAPLPTFAPMLRFPFLKEGDTAAKRDGFRAWMHEHGYRPAPVSIDASDWYYDQVLRKITADPAKVRQLRRAYVQHLLDRATHYDRLARRVLGRSPKHVLLLHTNQINARWLPDVITALRAKGWHFVSARSAFEDPLYRAQPDVLPAGESIVWALARQAKVEGLRYPAEDAEYEQPRLRALGLVQ